MKNTKKFLKIGAFLVLAAPIIAIISCSNSSHQPIIGDKNKSKDVADTDTAVKPQALISASQLEGAVPYSIDSLKKEAIAIGNHALWKWGLPYEAATQTISALRAFAQFSGYDFIETFKNKGYTIVDEDNVVINPQAAGSSVSKTQLEFLDVVKKLKETTTLTPAEIKDSTLTIGTIKNNLAGLRSAGVDTGSITDDQLDWDSKLSGGAWDHGSQFFSFNDYLHPGQRIVYFVNDNLLVAKIIRVKNNVQTYPVIKSEVSAQFKPFVEGIFSKFLACFISISGMLGMADFPTEQQAVVQFLMDKFLPQDAGDGDVLLNISQDKFDQFWNSFNNGSHNIQALKLLATGLDKTFASSQDMIDMTRNAKCQPFGGVSSPTSIDSELNGVSKMDENDLTTVYGFMDWLWESSSFPNLGHTFYDVSLSLEDNIKNYRGDGKNTLADLRQP